ncbi:Transcriptional regulator, contains XRE-family HTH domain [Paenibacillus tianmuensis]|uniref:Transcriptional regulator, contains XRE-family HTH domain n=1 Tax=Paenibacillus tianmuensis TaxID=624147 RepID=A0A1G4QGR0_9BACL|nr:helix-turn-helix transcriptional regulator [Paenibacillus tianmuensis]SCW43794.1 Transcriptional regulator, contains XRE-family HTH domain [Paenibacillus tianmuensis]
MFTVSERLRYARERINFKQKDVSERTGINNKTLSRYENGGSEPDINTLRILADLYEVSLDWILTGKDPVTTNTSNEVDLESILAQKKVMFRGVELTETEKNLLELSLINVILKAKELYISKK